MHSPFCHSFFFLSCSFFSVMFGFNPGIQTSVILRHDASRGSLDSPVKPGNDEREKKHENDEREKSRGMTRKEDDRKMTGRIWQGRREEMRKTDMIKKEKTGEIPPFQNIDVLS